MRVNNSALALVFVFASIIVTSILAAGICFSAYHTPFSIVLGILLLIGLMAEILCVCLPALIYDDIVSLKELYSSFISVDTRPLWSYITLFFTLHLYFILLPVCFVVIWVIQNTIGLLFSKFLNKTLPEVLGK